MCLSTSCASQPTPKAQIEAELTQQTRHFYDAVVAHNASTIYALLSPHYRASWDNASQFQAFFEQNYDAFLEYATALVDDPDPYRISAQPASDPCASFALDFDPNGQWNVRTNSEYPPSLQRQKMQLTALIQSNDFVRALQNYASKHPEWNGAQQRALIRSLKLNPIPLNDIHFWGNHAQITIPNQAQITLICADQAWRLDQCNLIP